MKWKNKEQLSLLFLIEISNILLVGIHTFTKVSLKASILSFILGSIISYFLLSIFLKVNREKTVLINTKNPLIAIPVFVINLILLSYSLTKITKFITYNIVSSIPYYILYTSILITSILIVKKGLSTIMKSSFIYLIMFFILTTITLIALFPKMDFQNVLPIVDTSYQNILKSTGLYIITQLSSFFHLFIFSTTLDKPTIKAFKKGFLRTQLFITIYTLIIISILGIHLTNIYPYPEVSIFKKVSFLNIIDRMESVFSLSYFLALFTNFTIVFYELIKILETYLKKEKRVFTLLISSLLIFIFSNLLEINTTLWLGCLSFLLFFSCLASKTKI